MKLNFKKEILLAILPAFGYLIAYNYELGYLSSFNLPETLAQIKLEQFVSFTVLFVFFVFAAIGAIDFIYGFYHIKNNHPIIRNIIKITWPFLLGIFIIWYFDLPAFNKYISIFVGLTIFFIALYLVLSLISTKKNRKYSLRERLGQEGKAKHSGSPSILDKVPFSKEISLLLISIFTLSFFSQAIGEKSGFDTRSYVVFKYKNGEYALIRDYNDKKIGVSIINGKFTKQYILIENSENLVFTIKILDHTFHE